MFKKVFLYIFILFTSISCKKIIDTTASFGKDEVKVEDFLTIKVNEEYSLGTPDYMKEMKTLHDEASFEYANIYKETYAIVIDESKQEFVDTFKELDIYNDEMSVLENYSDYQIKSLIESIENATHKNIEINIKNISSKHYELHGKIDGLNIGYLIGFIEGNEKMFMIMTWTLDSRFNKYENTFKMIQKSFKFI
ncbi:hypothetical protein [uncultured Polaribacter sp.]|uniref:hypothetical protein n=1 Tax=uncultured Polaribacter sp. TaxID=174711 RepID=UPI002637CCE5|nr:hypothetical protein [uncultured Polaribacter sp.]